MMWFKGVFIWLSVSLIVLTDGLLTSQLTDADRLRLNEVFNIALNSKELPAVHYAILGLKELKKPPPSPKEVCSFLLKSVTDNPSLENYYYVASSWKAIGNCPGSLPSASAAKVLSEGALSESTNALNLYQAVTGLVSLGQAIPQPAKIAKNVQALLKKDDSVSNLGYAFHIGSHLGNDGLFAFDRIDDALVQADEVNTKFLQFEGGLSITALVVSGVYKLAESLKKQPPVSADQAVKFANYFLSRRSVHTPKGAFHLVNILNTFANNKYQVPVVVSVVGAGGGQVSRKDGGKLTVRLTDVLGAALSPAAQLVLEAAIRQPDGLSIATKTKFTQSPQDKSVYSVALIDGTKGEAGVYETKISVTGGEARLVGTTNIPLSVRVMATIVLHQVRIGKADSDLSTQPKYENVAYPGGKLKELLDLDTMQKLSVRFSVKDEGSGKPLLVHQAFLRLSHETTHQEVIFLVEQDTTAGSYKFDLDIGSKAGELGHLSGLYSVELLLGDKVVSNPVSWKLADVKLRFPEQSLSSDVLTSHDQLFKPKPEIKHLFREPEKRPPVMVSNFFTGLVLLPLLILLALWARIGVNVSNFPISLSCIFFHLGLGSIFSLFGLFWWKLNMFETLKYLTALAPLTFLCGVKTLSKVASQKKAKD